jgi:ADP-ribosylglycohydrolase
MLGAIAGDIIGSIHEFGTPPADDVPLFQPDSHFTDDTLLTLATARCLLDGEDYAAAYRQACLDNPEQAWGLRFNAWAHSERQEPYNSLGNGSAMRVSPVGWWHNSEEAVLKEAERSAAVTHDHPEGIRGAQATALAVFLARRGADADTIRQAITARTGYDLSQPYDELLDTCRYNELCQGTVPPALTIALEAEDFEQVMRMALSLDADTDTLACIAGSLAEARFGVPAWIEAEVRRRLQPEQRALLDRFTDAVA